MKTISSITKTLLVCILTALLRTFGDLLNLNLDPFVSMRLLLVFRWSKACCAICMRWFLLFYHFRRDYSRCGNCRYCNCRRGVTFLIFYYCLLFLLRRIKLVFRICITDEAWLFNHFDSFSHLWSPSFKHSVNVIATCLGIWISFQDATAWIRIFLIARQKHIFIIVFGLGGDGHTNGRALAKANSFMSFRWCIWGNTLAYDCCIDI